MRLTRKMAISSFWIGAFLFTVQMASAQSDSTINLIQTDSSWGKEIFHFPLSFAPSIHYQGIEEARFPKGWADTTSDYFWSYAFCWKLETTHPLTVASLKQNLELYFDGLMLAQNTSTRRLPKTKVQITQQKNNRPHQSYTGTASIFDAFTTKSALKLYLSIDQLFCPLEKKSYILFRLSPKQSKHRIWQELKDVHITQKHPCHENVNKALKLS